ncbi:potassium channel protein [Caminibacter mediatlanticus TB-2]|uniref:Potassium channel protein n=1 Tax=Caminibacter mediatlanticus TB-2 TaxID=391592 RepID=A0AAI9F271_9BACT|nr:potassium channel protein [Caminibacter mediatlanticus]EDM23450.1 potassium channel protein [Caminibacter mediatlanticus TB-2]QCT94023.1 potassium channel protein [Caminibacter mediatlanticus TB-2]
MNKYKIKKPFYKRVAEFFHWEISEKPEVDLSPEIWSELKPFRTPLILTILITLFGTLGYIWIDKFPLMDALYQTGITFTTVGFGEIRPISPAGRLFTIFLIIAGFALFSYAVGILVDVINKGHLVALFKENRMLYKIARLKNHMVVCYHNEYTIDLTKELRRAHIPFVVVDPSDDIEKIAKKYKYPFYIKAEPHTLLALKKSHLSSAKGVITLSKNIPDNIAVISSVRLYEKDLKRAPYYILSIANQEEEIEKLQRLGANEVLSPTKLIAKRMTAITVDPDVNNLLEQFVYSIDTPLDLEEITINKKSWVAYKKLKDAHLRDVLNITVVGIKEENGKFIPMPKGDALLKPKDVLLVIGTSKDIKRARAIIRKAEKPKQIDFI